MADLIHISRPLLTLLIAYARAGAILLDVLTQSSSGGCRVASAILAALEIEEVTP